MTDWAIGLAIGLIVIASKTFDLCAPDILNHRTTPDQRGQCLSHNLSRPSKPTNYPQRLYLYKRLIQREMRIDLRD